MRKSRDMRKYANNVILESKTRFTSYYIVQSFSLSDKHTYENSGRR